MYASTLGLRVLRPEGLPINPLRLVRPTTRQEYVSLPRMFADTLRTIDSRMGNVQRNEVVEAVQQCYETAGITEERSTWDRPFPTVRELYSYMKSTGLGAGTPQSIVKDLADYGVFSDHDPPDDLDAFFDGAHVIDLRNFSGTPTVIRAVLCFFMNAFYDRMVQCGEAPLEMRGDRTLRQLRRIILVDEADDFISLNLHKLILTMQQGRSFGHGVFLSTQFLHHFNQNETPLRPLIGTWILHQMADLNPPDVRALLGISSRTELRERVQELSSLPQHTSLCLGLSNEGLRGLQRMRDLPYKDLGTLKR
jgi:DNA phosphorothioation-dependent restriction protein DptH